MKFGIVHFPGSTCHSDLIYVMSEIMDQEAILIWHKETKINKIDAILVPGMGISSNFPDYATLLMNSPILHHIINYAKGGGFVFGIGSGFNLLCHLGLLPGKIELNEHVAYICRNVHIKPVHTHSSITALLDTNMAYKIPVAIQYGRYYADEETIRGLREHKQILFLYSDSDGHLTEEANPNGSCGNIAGICNREKNVYGLIPQPERASDDELGNTDGRAIFESIIAYLK